MINGSLENSLFRLLFKYCSKMQAQIALAPLPIESEEEIYDDWKCMKTDKIYDF